MRLFVALDLKEIKTEASRLKQLIKERGLNLTEGAHLTLKFLGETDESKAKKIVERLGCVRSEPFKIRTDSIGFFPNEKNPKVVWWGIEESPEVMRLHEAIETALAEFGFRNDFRFHPHITLARVKFLQDKKKFLEKVRRLKPETNEVRVDRFILFKSTLTPEGPVYDVVEEFG